MFKAVALVLALVLLVSAASPALSKERTAAEKKRRNGILYIASGAVIAGIGIAVPMGPGEVIYVNGFPRVVSKATYGIMNYFSIALGVGSMLVGSVYLDQAKEMKEREKRKTRRVSLGISPHAVLLSVGF